MQEDNKLYEKLLQVKNLETSFYTHLGEVQAVRNVSFDLMKGQVLGIVGESGSGKSVTASSIMKIVQKPGQIKEGMINFKGKDLRKFSEKQMTSIRGKEIAMIFQDPMTSLNPVFTVGNQMVEVLRRHQNISKKEAKERSIEMLKLVGIPSPSKRFDNYPHEFSGGMRQRALIAIALSCNPELLIADEPTTALDVTIQAQILELMKDLKAKLNMSILLITHDLGVISEICDRVIIMYGGMILEEGNIDDIFYNSQNPYTIGLLKSVPRMNVDLKERLLPIPGTPPDLLVPPKGCPFSQRCTHAMNICFDECPPNYKVKESHYSKCWLLDENAPIVEGFKKGSKKSD